MWKKGDESSLVNLVDDVSARDIVDLPDQQDTSHQLFSCTADWTSLQEAATQEAHRAFKIKSLKVIHSQSLTSLVGMQKFMNLVEVDLSANMISSLDGVEGLLQLRVLNLSTNNLKTLSSSTGIQSRNLPSLQVLDLSHNEIESLEGLRLFENSVQLRVFKIFDNCISHLSELSLLSQFKILSSVCFKSGERTNPICSHTSYLATMLHCVPSLGSLDQRNLQAIPSRFKDVATSALKHSFLKDSQKPTKDVSISNIYQEPSRQSPLTEPFRISRPQFRKSRSPARASGFKQQPKKSTSPSRQNVHPNPRASYNRISCERSKARGVSKGEENELIGQQQYLIDRLRSEIQHLEERLGISESGEHQWKRKYKQVEVQKNELEREINDKSSQVKRRLLCLADENRKLTHEVQNRNKRLNKLEKERQEDRNSLQKKDEQIAQASRQITYLMKNHEQNSSKLQQREKQLAEAKFREQGLNDQLYDARNKQRQLENQLTKLHENKVTNDTRAIQRLSSMHEKHEEALARLSQQGVTIEQLNAKILELTDLNKQMDYSFQERAKQLVEEKERILRAETDRFQRTLKEKEKEREEKLRRLREEFAQDIGQFDKETQRMMKSERERTQKLELRVREEHQMNLDVLEDLKRMEMKNQKQEAIIEELRSTLKEEAKRWSGEVEAHRRALEEMGKQYNALKEESLKLKGNKDRYEYELVDLKSKQSRFEQRLRQKNQENAKLQEELTIARTESRVAQEQKQQEKEVIKELERVQEERLKGIRKEVEDLRQTVATKNKMLEDKNVLIGEQKEEAQELRDEVERLRENRNNYREQQEREIERVYDENQRLKHEKVELETRLQTIEEQFEEEGKAHLREEEDLKQELQEKKEKVETLTQEMASLVQVYHQLKQKIEELDREKAISTELRALLKEKEEEENQRKGEMARLREEGTKAMADKERDLERARKECQEVQEELHIFVKEREKEKLEFKGMMEALNRRFQ